MLERIANALVTRRSLSILTLWATLALVFSLWYYVRYLYCGCWLLAGKYLLISAINCWGLWSLGVSAERQRALDEVARVERDCLAFMLQLPGQVYVSVEVENSPW